MSQDGKDNQDLVRWASEYAEKSIDLYELLAVDALTAKADIHRAWRKRSLKYHPDKAGSGFDAEKWTLFERARDILCDASARATYDGLTKARLLRKQERAAMDKLHQRYADDLEAGERAAADERRERQRMDREALAKERQRLAAEKRMRDDETRRQREAAQDMEDLTEAKRRLQERKRERERKRQAKSFVKSSSSSAAAAAVAAGDKFGATLGPPNGTILVPGNYWVDLGDSIGSRQYWQLVCDKLRAVQTLRNNDAENSRETESLVAEMRRRIYEAERKYADSVLADGKT